MESITRRRRDAIAGWLVMACVVCSWPSGAVPPGRADTTATDKEHRVEQMPKTMDAQALRECIEQETGRVALVSVRKVQALQQGTRGAKVLLEVEVVRAIHGELHGVISVRAWGGPDFVQIGRRYIMAVDGRGSSSGHYILFGWAEVPEGREEAAILAHQQLIGTLKTQIEHDGALEE